jgi:hypothetical protein
MRISKISLCIGLMAALFLGASSEVLAQARLTIKGKVSSADNQPLEGVSVRVKGSTQGTATDKNGQYTIVADNSKAVLVFSSVGFANREETVGSRTTINVSLAAEAKESEEVVVIGYQTVRRKNLLASVSSVSAKDLKDIPVNSAAEALNGRLAGVTATTAEGSPDADVRVRIRGGMSITGDNSHYTS